MHERYVDLIGRILTWAEAEPDVYGIVVIGSQSRLDPPPDRWSDLDLMVLCDDPGRWLGSSDWLQSFGPPLSVFTERTPLGGHDWDWTVRRVLYADGRDVDFSLLPLAHVDEAIAMNAGILSWGYQVLYDANGTLETRLAGAVAGVTADTWGAASAAVTDAAQLQEAVQVLLYHVIWAQKKLARGEIWVAAGCLNSFLRPYLLALVEAHNQATGAPAMPFNYEGRFLERRTAPEVLHLLHGCAAGYDCGALTAALGSLLELIGTLAPAVYAAHGLAWDAAAFEGIGALWQQIAAEA